MRLVTYRSGDATRAGAVYQGYVVDVNRLTSGAAPAEMIALLTAGEPALTAVRRALAERDGAALAAQGLAQPQADVKLAAPVPTPGKIVAIGLNYRQHAVEANMEIPSEPVVFAKLPSTVIGPDEPIVIPPVTTKADYEAELAVVIGKPAKNVSAAAAYEYVAGYTCHNDVSAREWQFKTSQWMIGKNFDTFSPLGPCIVTRDEIPDPHALELRCRVDGQELQYSGTGDMIFAVPEVIAYLSQVMTLLPGDIIATGTPGGIGASRKPRRYLQPGQRVEVEISDVGILSNPVVAG